MDLKNLIKSLNVESLEFIFERNRGRRTAQEQQGWKAFKSINRSSHSVPLGGALITPAINLFGTFLTLTLTLISMSGK